MLYGMYLSTAGMKAQEYRNSVIANNLANSQTTAFKRDIALLEPRANASVEDPQMFGYNMPVLSDLSGGVTWGPTYTDLSQGSLRQTNNQTDVALSGRGFFVLQGKGNTPLLTRDGSFLVRADGTLVTAGDGTPVLGANRKPVHVNPRIPIEIAQNGQIMQDNKTVGKLALDTVKSPWDLKQLGQNQFTVVRPNAIEPAPAETQVRQGFLENSSVDPTVEMVNMITAQRIFSANAKMVTYQGQMLQELDTVGMVL